MQHLISAVLVSLTLVLSGCNLIGVVAYKVKGPDPVDAKFTPVKLPMLVLVENYSNPSVAHVDSQQLTAVLIDELKKHDVAPPVDPEVLYRLRDKDTAAYQKMTIPQLGKAAGAYQVLYVDVQKLGLEGDGAMARGVSAASVKIVEVKSGKSLWPGDITEGYPVGIQTPYTRMDQEINHAGLRTNLVKGTGDQIAKLFYKWTPEE